MTLVRPSDDKRAAGGSRLAIAPRHATSVGMTMRLMVPAVRLASLPRMAHAEPRAQQHSQREQDQPLERHVTRGKERVGRQVARGERDRTDLAEAREDR